MSRCKGYIPDDPSVVQAQIEERPAHRLVGGAMFLPVEVSHAHLLDHVPDQRDTSSCVGQAFSTALLLTARLAGIPIPRPSAKAVYDFARLVDQPYGRLVDDGCRPIAAATALEGKGAVAESDWPITWRGDGTSNINELPPLDVYASALAARLGSWYRIAPGFGAFELAARALARGYCPIFAMPVDEAYERFEGAGVYTGRTGPSLGGHMQALAGYGVDHVLVVSSWGTTHGDRGLVKISRDYFESGEATDIIVPTAVPAVAPERTA